MNKNTFLSIIVFLSMMLLTVPSVGAQTTQDDYKKALKAYLESRPSTYSNIDVEKMMGSLAPLNNQILLGFDHHKVEAIVQKYREEQFPDDFLETVFLPIYQSHVTIGELEQLTAMMQSTEGQQYEAHLVLIKKNMKENTGELRLFVFNTISALRTGRTPKDMKKRKDIPKKYADLFYENMDTASFSSLLNPYLNILTSNSQLGDAESNRVLQSALQHLTRNIGTIMLNNSYGILTEEDLLFQGRLMKSEAMQHVTEATRQLMANVVQYTQDLMAKYADWLVKQKPVCDFILQKMVDAMNVEAIGYEMENAADSVKIKFMMDDDSMVMNLVLSAEDLDSNEGPMTTKDLESLKNEHTYNLLTISQDFVHSLYYSGRKFVIQLTDDHGEEKCSVTFDNSQMKHILDHFETYKNVREALLLADEGKYKEALPLLKAAAAEGNQRACYELGTMYSEGEVVGENIVEAMRYYKRAAELDENLLLKADALKYIAMVHISGKALDEALAAIDAAIAVLPDEASYYEVKTVILITKDDKQGVRQMWEKLVSLDPDYAEISFNDFYKLFSRMKKTLK